MPKGPNGERRPADVIGCAVNVAKIATGETDDDCPKISGRFRSGKAGAEARNLKLSSVEKTKIACDAANQRWR